MAARGDMDAARAALDALMAEHPRHAALRVQASQLALERGDVPAALALAEEVAELRPPFDLEASPRTALEVLVQRVEHSLFGRSAPTETDYRECLEHYRTLVLAQESA